MFESWQLGLLLILELLVYPEDELLDELSCPAGYVLYRYRELVCDILEDSIFTLLLQAAHRSPTVTPLWAVYKMAVTRQVHSVQCIHNSTCTSTRHQSH